MTHSIKLLHISDLHFCSKKASDLVDNFLEYRNKNFPKMDLDFHIADESVKKALHNFIVDVDPKYIAITGDVTALGDESSFDAAHEWLSTIEPMSGGGRRKFIIVPGNHDILLMNLARLFLIAKSELGFLPKLFLKKYFKLFNIITSYMGDDWCNIDCLKNFQNFIGKSESYYNYPLSIPRKNWQLVLFPFNTANNDPIWMNIGAIRTTQWLLLKNWLNDENYKKDGTLKMVIAHHNPISSPNKIESDLINAYNSMPGGTDFLKTIQNKGVDILLHGHQHISDIYCYDFDLSDAGQAYTVSCGSSTHENGWCNIINIYDVNNALLEKYKYDNRNGFVTGGVNDNVEIAFERNTPRDKRTLSVRYEIKKYFYDDGKYEGEALFDSLQEPGSEIVYMSGRHLKTIRENQFEALEKLLTGNGSGVKTKIRMLISDPILLKRLAQSQHGPCDLWGTKEELDRLVSTANETISQFDKFIEKRSMEEKQRIDFRIAHTLLPFAAFIRDADKAWGKMAVKILPVGAIGDLENPIMALNRRNDKALFDFYAKYLRYLMLKSTPIHNNWSYGDNDLRIGIDQVMYDTIMNEKA